MVNHNPFKRLKTSINNHGFLATAKMSLGLIYRNVSQLGPNSRIAWTRFSSGDTVVRKVQGSLMKLDLSDVGISRELFLTGVHEPHSTLQFREQLRPGMVVLEVGANIGYYVLIAAQHISPGGKIVAIEPSPSNIQSLRENIALNDREDMVEVYPHAADTERGRLPFYVVSKSNLSSFVNREGHSIKLLEIIDVRVLPVDEIVEAEGLSIDYFRMDLEGFETEVIEGMIGTLAGKSPPQGGFIEVHSRILNENGASARTFLERMEELGYCIQVARWRGRGDIAVYSNLEFYAHPLAEDSHWETFFVRRS